MTTDAILPPDTDPPESDLLDPDLLDPEPEVVTDASTHAIGERLRRIRQQQGLSLADVQERSGGRWKAVVIGAYERGDRAVGIARLAELARFYGVPLVDLLPANRVEKQLAAEERELAARSGASRPVRLNLEPLRRPRTAEVAAVARFARRMQLRRGDHNGRVLTLRGGDLAAISLAVSASDRSLLKVLEREGVVGPT